MSELSKSLEKLYESKQYALFVEQLTEAKEAFSTKVYHYNLGTAYLKMGRPAMSRFHLEKALQEGSLSPGVYKNLGTAVGQLGVESAEKSHYFKDNAVNYVLGSPLELSLTLTLAFAVFWLALFRFKKINKIVFAIGAVCALLPFSLSFLTQQSYQRAILLEPAFSYEGPSRSFEESSEIPAGVSLVVGRGDGDWLYIEAPTHFAGWVDRSKLGIL